MIEAGCGPAATPAPCFQRWLLRLAGMLLLAAAAELARPEFWAPSETPKS